MLVLKLPGIAKYLCIFPSRIKNVNIPLDVPVLASPTVPGGQAQVNESP